MCLLKKSKQSLLFFALKRIGVMRPKLVYQNDVSNNFYLPVLQQKVLFPSYFYNFSY